MPRSLFALAVALAVTAAAGTVAAQKRGDSQRITADDIATQTNVQTAYDAIRRIRPNMLRPPTGIVMGDAQDHSKTGRIERSVFVDEVLQEGLESLKDVLAAEVVEIRLLQATETIVRFGNGHSFGAIMVTTNRRRP